MLSSPAAWDGNGERFRSGAAANRLRSPARSGTARARETERAANPERYSPNPYLGIPQAVGSCVQFGRRATISRGSRFFSLGPTVRASVSSRSAAAAPTSARIASRCSSQSSYMRPSCSAKRGTSSLLSSWRRAAASSGVQSLTWEGSVGIGTSGAVKT